jgi:glycosyltransferase involved in cell wall biosynthesis
MVRAACEAADVIVPISRATRDALLTVSPDAKARTRIIPMPVDADRFAIPSATAPTGFPSERPVLLCVGRLAREKGFEYAIRAMPIVRQSYPQASLVIVGRGPDAQRLQPLAEELLGPGVCRFPGFVAAEALPAYYAHADVFLLPSVLDDTGWQEGMGIVILEAAVAGCPAVATRAGGTSDVLVDGETGILVPERDAAALARAALAIISSASMRQRFAAGAHARAIENFSVQSVATQYEDAYRAALAGRGTGGPR